MPYEAFNHGLGTENNVIGMNAQKGPERKEWQNKRRLLNRLLNNYQLAHYDPDIHRVCTSYLNRLHHFNSDVFELMTQFGIAVISSTLFGLAEDDLPSPE
ncbi:MAG: hypothetical protein ACRCXC_01730 [Legionella sp.]